MTTARPASAALEVSPAAASAPAASGQAPYTPRSRTAHHRVLTPRPPPSAWPRPPADAATLPAPSASVGRPAAATASAGRPPAAPTSAVAHEVALTTAEQAPSQPAAQVEPASKPVPAAQPEPATLATPTAQTSADAHSEPKPEDEAANAAPSPPPTITATVQTATAASTSTESEPDRPPSQQTAEAPPPKRDAVAPLKYRDFRYQKEDKEDAGKDAGKRDELPPLELHDTWAWWFDRRHHSRAATHAEAYESSLRRFGSVATVHDFWRCYNNMPPMMDLAPGCNMHLFRNSIKPMWEDSANHNGAAIVARVSSHGSQKWQELLLAVIGEELVHGSGTLDVAGAIFNRRAKGDRLAVWIRDKDNQTVVKDVMTFFQKNLGLDPSFEPHPTQGHASAAVPERRGRR